MNVADVPERSWSRWDLDAHKTDGAKFSALGERGAPYSGEAVRRRSDEQGVEPVPVWRLRPRWWGENVTGSAPVCGGAATRHRSRLRGRGCLPSCDATRHVLHDERSLPGHRRHAAPATGRVPCRRSSDLHHTRFCPASFSPAGRCVLDAAWTAVVMHCCRQAALKPRDRSSRALRTFRTSGWMGIPDRERRIPSPSAATSTGGSAARRSQ